MAEEFEQNFALDRQKASKSYVDKFETTKYKLGGNENSESKKMKLC